MTFELMPHQKRVLQFMHDGCVLYGGTGTGKSVTAAKYYVDNHKDKDVYVITTAKKRDTLDWHHDFGNFAINANPELSVGGQLTVDSWNNIANYIDVEGAFFIFDEQRVVGTGTWVKSFIKLARKNNWILLSGTPGDTWLDYAPLFIANGWYKNITEFKREHVVYAAHVKFPKVDRYIGEGKLLKLRNKILVEMPYEKHTVRHMNYFDVGYDIDQWDLIVKKRWNPWEDQPIKDVGELFRCMRRTVNSDKSRLEAVMTLLKMHPRLIIFYNFNYELEALRALSDGITVAEYNGHRKHPIPETDRWVYLVQYTAGAEGWNCIETNAMCMYSLTYSYKNFEQALGRIDRLNTSHVNLYYYMLVSDSHIDKMVKKALMQKKNFNERDVALWSLDLFRNRADSTDEM